MAADLVDVVKSHLERLPPDLVKQLAAGDQPVTSYISAGWDGAGGQAVYNQAESLALNSSHIVFGGAALNRFDQGGERVWIDPSPGSHDVERPIVIIPAKESADLNEALSKHFEDGKAELESAPIVVPYTLDDGSQISITFNFVCKVEQVRIYYLLLCSTISCVYL